MNEWMNEWIMRWEWKELRKIWDEKEGGEGGCFTGQWSLPTVIAISYSYKNITVNQKSGKER